MKTLSIAASMAAAASATAISDSPSSCSKFHFTTHQEYGSSKNNEKFMQEKSTDKFAPRFDGFSFYDDDDDTQERVIMKNNNKRKREGKFPNRKRINSAAQKETAIIGEKYLRANSTNGVEITEVPVTKTVAFTSLKPQIFVESPKENETVQFFKVAFGAKEVSRDSHAKRKAIQEHVEGSGKHTGPLDILEKKSFHPTASIPVICSFNPPSNSSKNLPFHHPSQPNPLPFSNCSKNFTFNSIAQKTPINSNKINRIKKTIKLNLQESFDPIPDVNGFKVEFHKRVIRRFRANRTKGGERLSDKHHPITSQVPSLESRYKTATHKVLFAKSGEYVSITISQGQSSVNYEVEPRLVSFRNPKSNKVLKVDSRVFSGTSYGKQIDPYFDETLVDVKATPCFFR